MSDGASRRPASRTLGDLVDEMATGTPGAEALVFRDERLDYAGLRSANTMFARGRFFGVDDADHRTRAGHPRVDGRRGQ